MYNFTHTYQPTLNASTLALFLGRPAEGGWPRPLPCFRRDHESHNKYDSAVTGQIPKPVLKDVRRGWFIRGAIYAKQPGPCLPTCYECTCTRQIFQKVFYAYVEWNARTMWLMESTRQVNCSWGFPGPVWLYARLGSKGKNSGPSGGEHGTRKTTSHRGLPYKP